MLFYGLWKSRWKTGSDIAHQWRKGLLRTSAVRPHSDCCCHSGQLVLEEDWEDCLTMFGLKKQKLSHGNEECVTWDDMLPTFGSSYSLSQRMQTHDNAGTWANTQGCLTSACQPQRWLFVPATERQKHVPPVGHSGSWTDFQSPHALVWSPWAFVTQ